MSNRHSEFGRHLLSQRGKINFVTILIILIILSAVYFAIMLVPPYIEYYKMDEKVRSVANMAHRNKDDKALMRQLMKESEILELNLPYDAIIIERDPLNKWIDIKVNYASIVELVPFETEITLHFDIHVVETL
jgi:carbon starvation protein CstA